MVESPPWSTRCGTACPGRPGPGRRAAGGRSPRTGPGAADCIIVVLFQTVVTRDGHLLPAPAIGHLGPAPAHAGQARARHAHLGLLNLPATVDGQKCNCSSVRNFPVFKEFSSSSFSALSQAFKCFISQRNMFPAGGAARVRAEVLKLWNSFCLLHKLSIKALHWGQ